MKTLLYSSPWKSCLINVASLVGLCGHLNMKIHLDEDEHKPDFYISVPHSGIEVLYMK